MHFACAAPHSSATSTSILSRKFEDWLCPFSLGTLRRCVRMRRRSSSFRVAISCGILGFVLVVLGATLVVSRHSSERDGLDRTLQTTATEKAALVGTELERVRALALVTARIPPFTELYADKGSQAAAIAAVAGPSREINNALAYDWQLYPNRIVQAGYVDRRGPENARVVRGHRVPTRLLRRNVRLWPSFAQGANGSAGIASISAPFFSATAGTGVVAVTVPVNDAEGRKRAYVELQLSLSAVRSVLGKDVSDGVAMTLVDQSGATLTSSGKHVPLPSQLPRSGLGNSGRWRLAVSPVSERALSDGQWYVVSAGRAPTTLALALAPTQSGVLALALLLLLAAGVSLRRSRRETAEELAQEQQARAEAERLSRVDVMTGLFNRRHAMETVDHELARSGRDGSAVGLLLIDIDRFKRINDSQGHAGGDAVLIEVARRLRTGPRDWDTVARVGGEEFCIIAPGMDSEASLAQLGDRLRLAVAERPVTTPRGVSMPVTISVGAAIVHNGEGSSEHAIDCADRALYAAKRRGRNRLCCFSELDESDLRAEQPESVHLAEALANAGDLREGAPSQHSGEVAQLSVEVARRLGMSDEETLSVCLAGWLHDIGKISVPDHILTKPGPLTEQEWEVMRTHSVVGEKLLRGFPELAIACPAVRHHHEHYDGSGYPDHIAGEQIPLEARILAAADAYSAMTAARHYQEPRARDDAIEELRRCSGIHFDPIVVAALIDVITSEALSHQLAQEPLVVPTGPS
jgi:diguanylate cyclase (GGDEF)-like protein